MNISKKLIEETIEKTTGRDVIPLVNALKNKKNVSEVKLANEIKKDINETRNMLYKLHGLNLVSSTKQKDKKKGWYVYYWTLSSKKIKYLAKKSKEKHLDRLVLRLKKEKNNNFYSCSNKCMRIEFEKATDMNFKCPECGSLLDYEDNANTIQEIEKEINKLENFMNHK